MPAPPKPKPDFRSLHLDRRFYPCGLKPAPDQIASLRLLGHETLPEWNYTIKSQL